MKRATSPSFGDLVSAGGASGSVAAVSAPLEGKVSPSHAQAYCLWLLYVPFSAS